LSVVALWDFFLLPMSRGHWRGADLHMQTPSILPFRFFKPCV
jgi:hypothetical protein